MGLKHEDLRLVLAIREAGTLLGGARRLAIDHSTAFRRLNALEKSLGVRLFERAREGYAPTASGEAMIAAAARVDEEIVALERKLAGADLRPSGLVRVTTTDTGVELLAPIFAAFRAAHPAITLELVVANAFFTLSRRDADVAVRPSAEAPEELIAHRVADVATALYASRSHAAAQARTPPAERHWIGPDESLSHLAAARWLRRHTAPEQVVYRANSLLAWQAAARAGLGLALLPCYLGDVDPQLVRIAPPIAELGAALWVLIHPDLRRVARIRAFVDFALPRLDGLRPLLEGRQRRAGAPDRESYNGAQTAPHERAPQHVRRQARRSSAAKRGSGSARPKRP